MSEKIISTNSMETHTKNQLLRELLDGISLDDLRILVDLKNKMHSIPSPTPEKPIPASRTRKPVTTPRKSVKDMVKDYEDNIILPPPEFRDDYKPIPAPRTKKPVPLPRTKIEQVDKALKGYTKSFEISTKNNKDPLAQLQNTRKATAYHIKSILASMKGLKFIETLRVTFTTISDGGIVYKTAYFNSVAQTIINNLEVTESLQLSQQQILNKIAQWISEGSGWTIRSVDNHYLKLI